MAGSITKEVLEAVASAMVERACAKLSDKGLDGQRLTDREKESVKGLACQSVTTVAEVILTRNISAVDAGVHLMNNGVNLGKLTPSQQVYCRALIAEMAMHGGLLVGEVVATYTGAVAGANAGLIAGGLTGTMVAGPAGTAVGSGAGVIVGAGVPLALGAWQFFERAAQITNAAIDYHSQCGPLATSKVPPSQRIAPMM